MFERYTEKARNALFFARHEASQFGSPSIESEHLLLVLLREDKALSSLLFQSRTSVDSIRKQIEARRPSRTKIGRFVDLPLSDECKRVLGYAAEEADRAASEHIEPEHLLLGLLREETCLAAQVLHESGLTLASVREDLPIVREEPTRSGSDRAPQQGRYPDPNQLPQFSRDLTKAARNNSSEPLTGREKEMETLLEVLCSYTHNNPLLICPLGITASAVVELLAELFAGGYVPAFLQGKRLLALDLDRMAEADPNIFDIRLGAIARELIAQRDCIIFIDEIHRLADLNPFGELRRALSNGAIQCIGACTTADHDFTVRVMPWLSRCFRTVRVRPMLEDEVIRSLSARKHELENFHGVIYADEAIAHAVRYSAHYFPNESWFEKALETLDVAGARVKIRQPPLPKDLIEVQKQIEFIMHHVELSMANHEFEKARFYGDEERKEREVLHMLRKKHKRDDPSATLVGCDEIADVVSRSIGVPVEPFQDEPPIEEK